MDSRNLNLLVVEDDLEDEQLLCEALTEIEERRQWCKWQSANVVQVDQLADALDCLERERFDAVLLNLSLPDSPALLDTFLETRAAALETPIIVLADEEDENLAHRLVREGAEDVLLKSELECAPLARSIRYAIERRRRGQSQSCAGLLTGPVFHSLAFHFAGLALSQRIDLHILTLEVCGLATQTTEEREAAELLLLRAADALLKGTPPSALISRSHKTRFMILMAGASTIDAEWLAAQATNGVDQILSGLPGARTYSRVFPIDNVDSLRALVDAESKAETRQRAKPVMLAD